MTKGNWTSGVTSTEIIPANEYRGKLTIQLYAGSVTALGFGEAAVYDEGMRLITTGDTIELIDAIARRAVYAICDAQGSSSGGFQEG